MRVGDGTRARVAVKRRAAAAPCRRYTRADGQARPHDVLGVEPGATPTQIKAAWRRLARSNHPDLTGDDPAASRVATRRMAEINDAYAALTREATAGRRATGRRRPTTDDRSSRRHAQRRGGPPRTEADPAGDRPGRHERHVPAAQPGRRQRRRPDAAARPAAGPQRRRSVASRRAPRRRPARSSATGVRHFRRPPLPSLDAAEATVIPFGKFHDHTLGQIAAFEPSYIDWVAGTVNHDPDLVDGGAGHPGRPRSARRRCVGRIRHASARPVGLGSRADRPRRDRPETRRSPPDTGGRSI